MTKTPDWLFVGAVCTTRDGRRVRILCTDLRGSDAVAGAIEDRSTDAEYVVTWQKSGAFFLGAEKSKSDLVGPWVDKLPELEAGMRVQLRDGSMARILCTDRIGRGPVHGLYVRRADGREMSQTWTRTGCVSDQCESDRDIVKVLS